MHEGKVLFKKMDIDNFKLLAKHTDQLHDQGNSSGHMVNQCLEGNPTSAPPPKVLGQFMVEAATQ